MRLPPRLIAGAISPCCYRNTMRLTNPKRPALSEEPCNASSYYPAGYFFPPPQLIDGREGRLISTLRSALSTNLGNPSALLAVSAEAFLRAQTRDERLFGPAYADLAVSGATNFNAFVATPPQHDTVRALLEPRVVTLGRTDEDIDSAISLALDRAYRVAWTLRGFLPRGGLQWIAVSAEDDPPHRPVNVPGAASQFDLSVPVVATRDSFAIRIATRFTVFGLPPPPPPMDPLDAVRDRVPPPINVQPVIPEDARLLLFIHGHSSRLEECLDLAPRLAAHGFTVIAMDLPNCGYATKFDHEAAAPLPLLDLQHQIEGPHGALRFIARFVIDFVTALDQQQSGNIRLQLEAVMGGSLGGNTVIRLAQTMTFDLPWARTIISWSPASMWGQSWARALHRAGVDDRFYDAAKFEAVRNTRDRIADPETSVARANYFSQVFKSVPAQWAENWARTPDFFWFLIWAPLAAPIVLAAGGHSQPYFWYREGWEPCKSRLIDGSRFDRREIYHRFFRQWHWRVAHEQLIFQHLEPIDAQIARYQKITSRTLLAAAALDNGTPVRLYDNVRLMAKRMVNTRGTTLWLENTGHSIPNERPALFAEEIAAFLPPPRPRPGRVEQWSEWTSLESESLLAGSLTAICHANDGVFVFGVDRTNRRIKIKDRSRAGDWSTGWGEIGELQGVPASVTFASRLAIAPLEDGLLRIYAVRRDKRWVVHITQSGRSWRATDLGNETRQFFGNASSDLAVVERVGTGYDDVPMRLHLVGARINDGRILVRGHNATGYPNAYWNYQPDFGTTRLVGMPTFARDIRGLVHLFARDTEGDVRHIWEIEPDRWRSSWAEFGDQRGGGNLSVILRIDGRMEVFARGSAGDLQHRVETDPAGSWFEWASLGGQLAPSTRPAVAIDGWGRTHVFVRNTNNQIAHRHYEPPTGGWSPWETFAGVMGSDPVVVPQHNGTLLLLALNEAGIVHARDQTSAPG